MYGAPQVPSTGGGWFTIPVSAAATIGAVGFAVTNALIIGISLAIITGIVVSMFMLWRGEIKITRRGG